MQIKTVLNWSSGKDAAMALQILNSGNEYKVTHLLTTINEEHDRIVMHGVRERLLDAQAERMGMPLRKVKLPAAPTDDIYKSAMTALLSKLKSEGVQASAFGDILLEDLRQYREQQLQSIDVKPVFPLWKMDTVQLVKEIAANSIEAIIVCVNEKFLGKEFLGRKIDEELLNDLPANVDPCGENGEFHTFVYNAPFFTSPIRIATGEIVRKDYQQADNDADKWNTGFYFLDIDIANS